MENTIEKIRTAFADYVASEGCSCCRDTDAHERAMDELGKFLEMKRYDDDSGWDYSIYKSEAKQREL